jgi:hypothetical protein
MHVFSSDLQKYSQILGVFWSHMTSVYQGLAYFGGHIRKSDGQGPGYAVGQKHCGKHITSSISRLLLLYNSFKLWI